MKFVLAVFVALSISPVQASVDCPDNDNECMDYGNADCCAGQTGCWVYLEANDVPPEVGYVCTYRCINGPYNNLGQSFFCPKIDFIDFKDLNDD